MSYKDLFGFCQELHPHINRNVVRDETLKLTGTPSVRTAKTTLDINVCRGFYLSARNTDHQLVKQCGGHVIVLARELNYCWERFVFVKELMHLFDDPKEATDTGEKFERMLEEIGADGTTPADWSPQMCSEVKCFWMALGVLCPEKNRAEYAAARENAEIDDYTIALQLRIPKLYVPVLFQDRYQTIIRLLTE